MTELIQRAPKVAQLRRGDTVEEVPVDQVRAGDVVQVRTGEVVPVDGKLVSGEAVRDTSTLSDERLRETVGTGMDVRSGSANAGAPFDLRGLQAGGRELVGGAGAAGRAVAGGAGAVVRMADRYAGFFLLATLVIAGPPGRSAETRSGGCRWSW